MIVKTFNNQHGADCCCLVAKSCWTLCNPTDYSPPDSSVCGISQARILEWVAMTSSRGFSWSRHRTLLSCVRGRFFTAEPLGKPQGADGGDLITKSCPTLATPWTAALQAPLSMGFSRQEYWSGLPFLSPGDLPDPGIEPRSPALQADSLPTGVGGGGWGCKNKKANRTGWTKSGMIKTNGGSNWIHFAMAPWPSQALNSHMRF